MQSATETIAAVCTPGGSSALGIIRISGELAFDIIAKIFTPENGREFSSPQKRCVQSGQIAATFNLDSEVNLDAQVYLMPAPASFTCEDVAELMVCGAQPVLSAVLGKVISCGARHAHAGEFSLRAFLNGRIDLAQAEAVERVISAETEAGRREAISRVGGDLCRQMQEWQSQLLEISAAIEAVLDFAEEDIDEDLELQLCRQLEELSRQCQQLANTSAHHQPEDNGIRILFAGLTNSGKSSLLNAILKEERAIVSEQRSTTRDRIIYQHKIERFTFALEDCPGIDNAISTLSQAASKLAQKEYEAAPLLLMVVDSSVPAYDELESFINQIPPCRMIVVYNKIDLASEDDIAKVRALIDTRGQLVVAGECRCCALSGEGVEQLQRLFYDEAVADMSVGGGLLTRREACEIETAARHCSGAAELIGMGLELAAIELRLAYEAFTRASGQGYAEDILENVFSRFCIGK